MLNSLYAAAPSIENQYYTRLFHYLTYSIGRCQISARDRANVGYFAPLGRLDLAPNTELCLGLVHHTDGIEGTRKPIEMARKQMRYYAVSTESGFGRCDPKTIPELLLIHLAASDYARTTGKRVDCQAN